MEKRLFGTIGMLARRIAPLLQRSLNQSRIRIVRNQNQLPGRCFGIRATSARCEQHMSETQYHEICDGYFDALQEALSPLEDLELMEDLSYSVRF